MKSRIHFALAVLALSVPATAKLLDGSLKPDGGEAFKPGETITIEWTATTAENGKYDIYLSKDGGKTWPTEFAEGWQGSTVDGAKNAYRWAIPSGINTTQARIRVCQLSGGHCVQPGVYTLASGDFTISPTAGIGAENLSGYGSSSLTFLPGGNGLEIQMKLSEAGPVLLQVLDASGKVVESLIDERLDAGEHRRSLVSKRLGSAGPMFVRLVQAGRTRTWMRLSPG